MTMNKRRKSQKGRSTYAQSYLQEADDSSQRDYNQPIHYQKVIPDDYERDNDDDE